MFSNTAAPYSAHFHNRFQISAGSTIPLMWKVKEQRISPQLTSPFGTIVDAKRPPACAKWHMSRRTSILALANKEDSHAPVHTKDRTICNATAWSTALSEVAKGKILSGVRTTAHIFARTPCRVGVGWVGIPVVRAGKSWWGRIRGPSKVGSPGGREASLVRQTIFCGKILF